MMQNEESIPKIRDPSSAVLQKVNKQYIVDSTTYQDALIEANDATERLNNSCHSAHTDSKHNDNKSAVLTICM